MIIALQRPMSREKWKQERARQRRRRHFEQKFFFPVCKRAMWVIAVMLLVGLALQTMAGQQESLASLVLGASSILVGFASVLLWVVAMTSLLFFTSFNAWVPKGCVTARSVGYPDPKEAPDCNPDFDTPPPRHRPRR